MGAICIYPSKISRLVTYAHNHDRRPCKRWDTPLHTGFRKSELLSLTWEDVDFEKQSITVKAGYAKNGESRTIPMNDVLTTTLEEVRITSAVSGPVFRNRTGAPYCSFRTAFERAVRKAVVPDFTFHDLR